MLGVRLFEMNVEKNPLFLSVVEKPIERKYYSGRFVVRLPRYLHKRLVKQAAEEGVSLNQLVVSLLSERLLKITTI